MIIVYVNKSAKRYVIFVIFYRMTCTTIYSALRKRFNNSPGYKHRLRALILSLGMIRIRMNSKIRKLMKRCKALIKAQIFRDPAGWSVYERLRNDVTEELRMAEANYWSSKLNDTRSDSKEF